MPKIDVSQVPERKGSGYPPPFDNWTISLAASPLGICPLEDNLEPENSTAPTHTGVAAEAPHTRWLEISPNLGELGWLTLSQPAATKARMCAMHRRRCL